MSQNEKTLTWVPTRDTLVNISCTSVLCSHRGKNIHTSGVTPQSASYRYDWIHFFFHFSRDRKKTGATGDPGPTNLTFFNKHSNMKNDDAPKVIVIHVLDNIVSGSLRIGEFSGMAELILHAAKFASSNMVSRIIHFFMYQTRPKSSISLSFPL